MIRLRHIHRPIVAVLVVASLAAAPLVLGEFRQFLFTDVLIFGLLAVSLDLLVGYTGLISLGHAAFFGIGAYGAALVATRLTANAFAEIGIAVGATIVIAAAVGALSVRTRGVYFLMITLALAQLLHTLATTWDSVTRGSNGIPLPPTTIHGDDGSFLAGQDAFYYYVLVCVLIGYALLRAIVGSPFGRTLVGIRENEARMSSIGYSVPAYKLGAFCLAAAFAGLAGVLSAQHTIYVSPSTLGFEISALALIAVIIGGRATLFGPALGAAFVFVLRDEISSAFAEHWRLALGLVFAATVYLLPRGLGGLVHTLDRILSARPASARSVESSRAP